MTEKEREHVASLEKQLRLSRAFRWTDAVKPDVPPPTSGNKPYTSGFLFNHHRRIDDVYEAWSSTVYHGSGEPPKEVGRYYSASQNSVRLFSTKLLALRALRNCVEREAAEKLAGIDERIDAEILASGGDAA